VTDRQESGNPNRELEAMLPRRLLNFLVTLVGRHRLRHEIRRLCHPDAAVQRRARMAVMAAPYLSRPLLRRIAFRTRSKLACVAAELLYEMGDIQGLYALLSQYSDRYMFAYFSGPLRTMLQRIGYAQILDVLENCLDRLETPPLPHDHWSLALSVYALNALITLRADVPRTVWSRAITVSCPGFEDLRVCRSVVPLQASPLSADDPRVGKTLVAVRRAAVDALLTLWPQQAFELLSEALQHPDIQVRLTAIYGLRRLRDSRAYVLLQPIAANRRDLLSRDARRAIEALGSSQPDVLTLVRASDAGGAPPAELLRPATTTTTHETGQLLRPVVHDAADQPVQVQAIEPSSHNHNPVP
jgi:hypothetical protein